MTENIKQNSLGRIIENHKPTYLAFGKRMYHAGTRDLVTNEIFRRVEPSGKTIGEYMA
jgi:hypothetical protein